MRDWRGKITWRVRKLCVTSCFSGLFSLFSANRVETVRFLLEKGASVNPTYPGGNT